MNIESTVITKLRDLPPERQQEVVDFIEFLGTKSPVRRRRKSPRGLWEDLEVDITEDDISALRREMWSNFPREDL